MVTCLTTLICNSPPCPIFTPRSPRRTILAAGSPDFTGFGSSFSCHSSRIRFTSHSSTLGLDSPSFRFTYLGRDRARVAAGTDNGAGGIGGSGGLSGGGGGGGDEGFGGDSDAGSKFSLLSWYLNLLAKFPVMTKAVTSALLTLIGDLVCQLAVDRVPSVDYKRTFLFTLLGLVLVGPTLHFWYLYLSTAITRPGSSGALLRLLVDQFLFAPAFIGVFLSALVTLEGRPSEVVPKLKQEWFSSVVANWQLWIPFQYFNFRFVPQQFQVLAANFISLIWNVILSYKAHKQIVVEK